MKISLNNHPVAAHIAEDLFADNEVSKARLQLAFIASLFAASWIIGSLRMGEVISANSHGVSVLASLLGM
ncbi:hypothetical protein SAMN05216296_0764 [Pseudomonas pohangensis]|jgi:hypothetical protein|uniref:Uncharacterized protein n=1 Tax=Pseudomonas pohangensis TaxID=364197 RepID=A0A1H2EGY7_9PSED|nr:hypothetical protein [Pseudomonas pohangensis]SDT94253.1 hypothetical protein SAMN05216296_0764 [Pseudomonas pohangensis]